MQNIARSEGLRVLVYGGRTWDNRVAVFDYLDMIHGRRPIKLVIHGACPNRRNRHTGALIWSADMLGQSWAVSREIIYCGVPARWKTGRYRKREGMIRNQRMLDLTRPTLGVEFPGHTGTTDMHQRLEKAGIRIAKFPLLDIELD